MPHRQAGHDPFHIGQPGHLNANLLTHIQMLQKPGHLLLPIDNALALPSGAASVRQAGGLQPPSPSCQSHAVDCPETHRRAFLLVPAIGGSPGQFPYRKHQQLSSDGSAVACCQSALFQDNRVARQPPKASPARIPQTRRGCQPDRMTRASVDPMSTQRELATVLKCRQPPRPANQGQAKLFGTTSSEGSSWAISVSRPASEISLTIKSPVDMSAHATAMVAPDRPRAADSYAGAATATHPRSAFPE